MGQKIGLPFETFEHGADIGIRGRGKTLDEAFENAARAMFSLMVEDIGTIMPEKTVHISCASYDREGLLTAWLNSLLAEASISGILFRDFTCSIKDTSATGTATGEPFDPSRHKAGVEVKGATFTELRVFEEGGIWTAQCVVDV